MPSRKPSQVGPAVGPGVRVTLTRSLIGLHPAHVRTLRALGLRKIRGSVRHADTRAIRGMIAQVAYAVRVEEETPA